MSSPLAEVWPDFYLMHNFIRDQRISIQYYPIRKKKNWLCKELSDKRATKKHDNFFLLGFY
jgi:hypothetical protein